MDCNVPFMLYTDFESILKLIDQQSREKMNKMKTERKGKTPYTEKINTPVPSGWCVRNIFSAYGDVPDPLKMYLGKDLSGLDKLVSNLDDDQCKHLKDFTGERKFLGL